MGKVFSVVQRRAKRFNVENRAERIISQEKPTPAPKYPSTIQEITSLQSENPTVLEELAKKNIVLDDRLRKVFVTSHGPEIAEVEVDPTRPLPQDRGTVDDFELGYKEPNMIPKGRASLRQAMQFISDHQADPSLWPAAAIAKEYKIDQEIIEKVLSHFRAFQIHLPEKPGEDRTATPLIDNIKQRLLQSREKPEPQETK